jgi:hypothetical protein
VTSRRKKIPIHATVSIIDICSESLGNRNAASDGASRPKSLDPGLYLRSYPQSLWVALV